MVEMQETANILHTATSRSLVVLDEIGRGTATFDGLSIAWAVAEYLATNPKVRPKTLFATHYHELTDLADATPGVVNFHVAAREWKDDIIFLRKIVPGRSDRSYGIQVARLAGLPRRSSIARARFSARSSATSWRAAAGRRSAARRPIRSGSSGLFQAPAAETDRLREKLCGGRRRSDDAARGADAAGGAEEHVVTERAMLRSQSPASATSSRRSRQPKVAVMLMLGFSSGLPFFLTGNTLGYWLRDAGHDAGGDRVPLVGRARLFAEVPVGADHRSRRRADVRTARPPPRLDAPQPAPDRARPGRHVGDRSRRRPGVRSASSRSLVAFSSSTQDIVVDAWRIEAAADSDELGLLSAAYQLGYRVAILVTDAVILIIANHFGWPISYTAMAVLMAIGVSASLMATEPLRAKKAFEAKAETPLWTRARLLRRRDRPVQRILPRLRLARAADARDDQLLPVARVHDGADGEPALSRPRALEGRRRRRARLDRPRRVARRHRRGRILRAALRLHPDADRRRHPQDARHRELCDAGVRRPDVPRVRRRDVRPTISASASRASRS